MGATIDPMGGVEATGGSELSVVDRMTRPARRLSAPTPTSNHVHFDNLRLAVASVNVGEFGGTEKGATPNGATPNGACAGGGGIVGVPAVGSADEPSGVGDGVPSVPT